MDWMSELENLTRDPFYSALNENGYTSREELLELVKKYGWRPVSEPPPDSGWYLVTCDLEEAENNFIRSVEVCGYNPLKIPGDHWQWNGVLAWMPLPEPYKNEGE